MAAAQEARVHYSSASCSATHHALEAAQGGSEGEGSQGEGSEEAGGGEPPLMERIVRGIVEVPPLCTGGTGCG